MNKLMMAVIVGALALVQMSCGPCVPGEETSCTCSDGRKGSQTCSSSGSRFNSCECSGPTPQQNTGGGGGSNDGPTCGSKPSGAVILNCNCLFTSVTPGSTVTATGCSSCRATMVLCNPNIVGFCAGGGIPWGNVCN